MKNNNKLHSGGFTLIEMAIVLVIGGVLMTAAAAMLNTYLQSSRLALTQSRMQDIDNALAQYVSVNGALPCPANLNDAPGTSTYGRSITDKLRPFTIPTASYATDVNDCFKNASASGPDTFKTTTSITLPVTPTPANNTSIVIGAVPTASLNLPDSEMSDAWGDRFVYAVTDYLTVPGLYSPLQGAIDIIDGKGNHIVGAGFTPADYAQYVIVSYGPDRAGAYSAAGVPGEACPTSTSALEYTNCTLPTAVFRKTMQISTASGDAYFDDLVIYHSQMNANSTIPILLPSGMVAPFISSTSALTVCPAGWMPYSGGACTPPAATPPTYPYAGICCQKE